MEKVSYNEPAIEVKNISKKFRLYHEKHNSIFTYVFSFFNKKNHYTELSVLKNISFQVNKGEMLGVIGFNGSGKTTLLRIISGIYNSDNGEIIVNGKIIPILELGTGFNPELTARENIIVYGVILGFSIKEIKSRIEEIIKFAEIESFLDTKLKKFSTGMIARLAFSTAIQISPDILLIDEVLSVGDISFQEKSLKAIMNFKKQGKTIVFISHSIEQVQHFCDTVIWLHEGIIKKHGDPVSVVNEYRKFASEKQLIG